MGSVSRTSLSVGIGVLCLFILSLTLMFLLGPGIDLSESVSILRGAEGLLLVAALAVHYLCFLFRGARWMLLLRSLFPGRPSLGLFVCARQIFDAWFVNSITFFRLGDPFRAYLCQRRGASFVSALGALAAERVVDGASLFILMVVSISVLLLSSSWSGLWALLWISVGLSFFAALLLLGILLTRGRTFSWLPLWLARLSEQFHQGVLSSLSNLPSTSALGVLGWLAEAGRFYLVALSLGIFLSPEAVIFLTLAGALLSLFPTPGGIGAVEAGLTGLAVVVVGLSMPEATALVLADRAVNLMSAVFVGSISVGLRPVWSRFPVLALRRAFSGRPGNYPEDR